MNAYKVTDSEGVYVIVAAENRRQALGMHPDDGGVHCTLLERDIESGYGDITFEYQRTRGVDLILSGVIQPNWYNSLKDPAFDDYRDWYGFTHEAVYPELVR